MDCKEKTVLVTGATSGIGRACVERLLEAGARVIGIGRNQERLAQLQEAHGERFEGISFDLSQVDRLTELVSQLPAVDGIVMSAGVGYNNPVKYFKRELFDETVTVNLISPTLLAVELANAKKINKNGSIVFLSSINGSSVFTMGLLAYSVSKAGLAGTTMSLATELAPRGIRVNSMAPGMVDTEMADRVENSLSSEMLEADKKSYPLGKRYATTREVADLATFLLSDSSSFISGQTITIDGARSFQY